MRETYLDKLEAEGIPRPETLEEVIRTKIEMLEEVLAELEHLSSSELAELPRNRKFEAWAEAKQRIHFLSADERELNSMLVKMFDHIYCNAVEWLYEN